VWVKAAEMRREGVRITRNGNMKQDIEKESSDSEKFKEGKKKSMKKTSLETCDRIKEIATT